jgi:ATP-dependent Clp protease ATP-binding subunit ClpB
VWNVLLQVLDDGRLTDAHGNVVDFKNTVIILTSNVGTAAASEIEQRRDLDSQQRHALVREAVLTEVRLHFRPEFLNRLDELVVFRRLERDHIRAIIDIQLDRLNARLATRDMRAEVTEAAKNVLMTAGWDPQYGARPLKRAMQRLIENELARRVLGGELGAGDMVRIDARDGELTFERRLPN